MCTHNAYRNLSDDGYAACLSACADKVSPTSLHEAALNVMCMVCGDKAIVQLLFTCSKIYVKLVANIYPIPSHVESPKR